MAQDIAQKQRLHPCSILRLQHGCGVVFGTHIQTLPRSPMAVEKAGNLILLTPWGALGLPTPIQGPRFDNQCFPSATFSKASEPWRCSK